MLRPPNLKRTVVRVTLLIGLSTAAGGTLAGPHERDPYESFNRKIFAFNTALDDYLLRPAAVVYRDVMPDFANKAVTNFFNNLRDVPTLANEILQLKHYEAARTTARIIFNTIYGVGGLIDVGTFFELQGSKEDFGQTLNFYGVPQGPYFMLPLFGPATASDAAGKVADAFVDPLYGLTDTVKFGLAGLKAVDIRADIIPAENLVVGDRYTFVRGAYLQARDFAIMDGKVENDPFLDEQLDDYE